MDLTKIIRDVPDFPKPGIIFKDITPMLADAKAFRAAIDMFVEQHRGDNPPPDCIVGIESRGFVFATALAYALGCGVVLIRKPGKLPAKTISQSYALEYGEGSLEIHEDAIAPGARVVIIDDVLATGGTLEAAALLVEKLGGKITAIGTLIELTFLNGREKLGGRPFYSFIKY